jgi:hypothetical protein
MDLIGQKFKKTNKTQKNHLAGLFLKKPRAGLFSKNPGFCQPCLWQISWLVKSCSVLQRRNILKIVMHGAPDTELDGYSANKKTR